MANVITGFLETLVAAAGDYNAAVVGNLQFLKAVYLDVKPDETARAGEQLQVYFPDTGPFTQQGAADWTPVDIDPAFTNLTFNQNPGKAILIRDFEQWQTAIAIKEKFIDPMRKRCLEFINGAIAGLITPTNFNVNTPVQAASPQVLQSTDFARAWNRLAAAKVPLTDPNDLSCLMHNDVYSNTIINPSMVQENIVGEMIASQTRLTGVLPNSFKFDQKWDQQAPKTVTALTGTVAVSNGSATVTGTGTSFTSSLVGTYVVFGNDPNLVSYTVESVASTTSLTLSAAYAGPSTASTTISSQSYTCLAMQRYAIGLAVRPMPKPDADYVDYVTIWIDQIPLRVMISYQHLNGGYLVTVDSGFAVGVLRPSFGCIINC